MGASIGDSRPFHPGQVEGCFGVGLSTGVVIGVDGGSVHSTKKRVVVFFRNPENKQRCHHPL